MSRMPASVTVQCNGCQTTRVIGPGEIGANDFPMCDKCYLPMCVVEARSERPTSRPRSRATLNLKQR